jgi:putative transposase
MKRKRFTEEQIIGVLKESEAGREDGRHLSASWHQLGHVLHLAEDVRRGGRSMAAWSASEAKRLRELEIENAKLKRIVADQMLDMTVDEGASGKKLVTPMAKRKAVGF